MHPARRVSESSACESSGVERETLNVDSYRGLSPAWASARHVSVCAMEKSTVLDFSNANMVAMMKKVKVETPRKSGVASAMQVTTDDERWRRIGAQVRTHISNHLDPRARDAVGRPCAAAPNAEH